MAVRSKTGKLPHPLFSHQLLCQDVWMIEEKYFISWNRANIFYIRGRNKDLLIDTGVGVYDLPNYLLWSGLWESRDKPLVVALTHSHFDHTGGAHQFDGLAESIFIHGSELKYVKNGSCYMTVSWITPQEVVPKPVREWKSTDYNVKEVKNLKIINEGDVIDLGDKSFKILHVPGHSPGSIAIHGNGILATGDTVYRTDAELMDWYPGSSVRLMARSIQRLEQLAKNNNEVTLALPGHNEPLTREELLQATKRHLEGNQLKQRMLIKSWSRLKSKMVFSLHSLYRGLPESARDWTFN